MLQKFLIFLSLYFSSFGIFAQFLFKTEHMNEKNIHENEWGFGEYDSELIDKILQPSITTLVNSHQRLCTQKGRHIEPFQLKREIESCTEDPVRKFVEDIMATTPKEVQIIKFAYYKINHGIMNFIKLTDKELDALRRQVLSPLCHVSIEIFNCFDPRLHNITSNCITAVDENTIEYTHMLFQSICYKNGTRIIDFINGGGFGCLERYQEKADDCFEGKFDYKTDIGGKMAGLCRSLDLLHNCVEKTLKACPLQGPMDVMQTILIELKKWTKDACVNAEINGTLPVTTFYSTFLTMMSIISMITIISNIRTT